MIAEQEREDKPKRKKKGKGGKGKKRLKLGRSFGGDDGDGYEVHYISYNCYFFIYYAP